MTIPHKLYNTYADYLQERYGEKVYKLTINIPGTCPNRDGTIGEGGCIFCDEAGSGFLVMPNTLEIEKQLRENKEHFQQKFKARKFIAYFQAFTNTYLPLERFKENILAASRLEGLVAIAISTRPDCIRDDYLAFLAEIAQKMKLDIVIELGLQTVNYHTLKKINRGHTLAEFIDAVLRIKKYGFQVVTHLILNLPGDDRDDVVECAKVLSALNVDCVKLHSLYIVKNTVLSQMYERGEIQMISMEEYMERVIIFLEYLAPNIVVQRLIGKGIRGNLLFCNWGTSWWKIKDTIEERMAAQGRYQGKKFDYLNGKALDSGIEERY